MSENNITIDFQSQKAHRITVLLVDDQAMIGEAVRRMLAGEDDIVFHFCSDPTLAIKTAIEVKPTVILQDLMMPDIDGLTLVKYFRAEPLTRDIPLIVLSSEENAKIKADAFSFGANDYLIKLPDRLELVARIRYHSRGYIHMLERNEAFNAMAETQRALAAELADAAEYVASLLPQELEGEIAVNWKFIPSTSLGGDGFGYHWLDNEHFAMFLLDVAGHGVGAALLSVSVIEALRTQTLPHTDFYNPADVLKQLNRAFKMQEHNHKFFTIWYGVYNRASRELIYSSGGHHASLLLTGNSPDTVKVVQLRTQGVMIGALDGAEYINASVAIQPFSRLYIYSDGTFEIIDPADKMWEFSEFFKLMTTPVNGDFPSVDAILKKIASVKGTESFDDDFSVIRIAFNS